MKERKPKFKCIVCDEPERIEYYKKEAPLYDLKGAILALKLCAPHATELDGIHAERSKTEPQEEP